MKNELEGPAGGSGREEAIATNNGNLRILDS
jgi:hypothetical protein